MKVQLKSWEWMSSVERETQLKKERESKADLWGLPQGGTGLEKRLRVR